MAHTVILKNTLGTDSIFEGIPVPASGQIDIEDSFLRDKLAQNDDLIASIVSGDSVINNGTSDLSATLGIHHLTIRPVVTALAEAPSSPIHGEQVFAQYGNHNGVYSYDSTRTKWLSEETFTNSFCQNAADAAPFVLLPWIDGAPAYLNTSGMKETATLIGAVGSVQNVSADSTVTFTIYALTNTAAYDFTIIQTFNEALLVAAGSNRVFSDFTFNKDYGKHFRPWVYRASTAGATITNPACTIYVKWRLA